MRTGINLLMLIGVGITACKAKVEYIKPDSRLGASAAEESDANPAPTPPPASSEEEPTEPIPADGSGAIASPDPTPTSDPATDFVNTGVFSYREPTIPFPDSDLWTDDAFINPTPPMTTEDVYKEVDWGAYVDVQWDLGAASDADLAVYPRYGDNRDTALITYRVPAEKIPTGNFTIATDQLEPGRYDVVLTITQPAPPIAYYLLLVVRPIIELSIVQEGLLGPRVEAPMSISAYLPNGTDRTDLGLKEGSTQVGLESWDSRSSGSYPLVFTPTSEGTKSIVGTVRKNDVDGIPDEVSFDVSADCGDPYTCLVTELADICSDSSSFKSQRSVLQVPKFSHCAYDSGDNLPAAGNQSYNFLKAEKHQSVPVPTPNGIICGLKTFRAINSVIQRDQMAIVLNDVMIASSVQSMRTLITPTNDMHGFTRFDWLLMRGDQGITIPGAAANPPDYCLGMETGAGTCSIPERSDPHEVAGLLELSPRDDVIQRLMAHFQSTNSDLDLSLTIYAFGDDNPEDCQFTDTGTEGFVPIELEWWYVDHPSR